MQGELGKNLISPAAADRLIAAHEGDLALLYLFIQRSGSHDLEKAAGELCRTLREMEAAYEKLSRMGLVKDGESCTLPRQTVRERKLLPADELPEYSAEEIVRRTQGDSAFQAVMHELEGIYGQRLSTPELRKLFAIYDHYALPAEVLMVLMHYCVDISEGRKPTIRFIEKQACFWANREILTLEQADEYISLSRQRREESGKVASALGIGGRKLSPTEEKYISSWLDMGFGLEVIELAFDRTVTNTGGLKWGYMNRILESWKEKGLFDVAEIEEKDSRRRTQAKPGREQSIDMDRLKAVLDKI